MNKTLKGVALLVRNNWNAAKRTFEFMTRTAALSVAFQEAGEAVCGARRVQRCTLAYLPAAILDILFQQELFLRRIAKLSVMKGMLSSNSFFMLSDVIYRIDSMFALPSGSPFMCVVQQYDVRYSPSFSSVSSSLFFGRSFTALPLDGDFVRSVFPVVCVPVRVDGCELLIKVIE